MPPKASPGAKAAAQTASVARKEEKEKTAAAHAALVQAKVGQLSNTHRAGTLAFVKQGKFPWWPAMVTYDPLQGAFCRAGANGQPDKYHMLFFGNVPQRAWISAKALRLWEGPKGAGVDIREQQTMPKKYEGEWMPALRFAEEAHRMPHHRRLGAFGWIEDLRQLAGDPESEDEDPSPAAERGKKRKRAKKDPNAPKRPRTSFLLFCQEKRARLTAENPSLKMTEVVQKLGELWRELPAEQRIKYEKAAASEKNTYLALMADYTPPALEMLASATASVTTASAAPDSKKRKKSANEDANPNESSCSVCEEGGRLLCCEGGCFRSFHLHCLGLTDLPAGVFVCDACETGVETCLYCHQLGATVEMLVCSHEQCSKAFHKQCARELPRATDNIKQDGFVCPRHRCANSGLPSTSASSLLYCVSCSCNRRAFSTTLPSAVSIFKLRKRGLGK